MKILHSSAILILGIICACSPSKQYYDFNECINEETKAGALLRIAQDYCRRFVAVEGEGILETPYQRYKNHSGATFIIIDGKQVILEHTAINPRTGETLGLVGEDWVRLK